MKAHVTTARYLTCEVVRKLGWKKSGLKSSVMQEQKGYVA